MSAAHPEPAKRTNMLLFRKFKQRHYQKLTGLGDGRADEIDSRSLSADDRLFDATLYIALRRLWRVERHRSSRFGVRPSICRLFSICHRIKSCDKCLNSVAKD